MIRGFRLRVLLFCVVWMVSGASLFAMDGSSGSDQLFFELEQLSDDDFLKIYSIVIQIDFLRRNCELCAPFDVDPEINLQQSVNEYGDKLEEVLSKNNIESFPEGCDEKKWALYFVKKVKEHKRKRIFAKKPIP